MDTEVVMLEGKRAWVFAMVCLPGTLASAALAALPARLPAGESRYEARLSQLGLGPRHDGGRAVPEGPAWESLSDAQRGWLVTRLRHMDKPLDAWLREAYGERAGELVRYGRDGQAAFTAAGRVALIRSLSAAPRSARGARAGRKNPLEGLLARLSGREKGAGSPVAAAAFDGARARPARTAPEPRPAAAARGERRTRERARPRKIDTLPPEVAGKVRALPDERLLFLQQELADARRWRWQGYATLVGNLVALIASAAAGQPVAAWIISTGALTALIAVVSNEIRIRELEEKVRAGGLPVR